MDGLHIGVQAGSGSSSIAQNLAVSLAYNGRRVLVIDTNFRRPRQHELFNTPAQPGLVDILQGAEDLIDESIVTLENPKVDVLPAGDSRTAPPELLERPAFQNLLAALEPRYDLILIDAPPALLSSEATMLTKYVDAVAVVVHAMSEKRGMVGRLLQQLSGQRAEMLGLILNGVRTSAGGYFRKNYMEFYRYRQAAGRKKPGKAQAAAAAV